MDGRTHNVGFDRPRLNHREYVEYLYTCAARWRKEPNGAAWADRIYQKAEIMGRLTPRTCAVCRRAVNQ
jgi:hypothetical protein